MKLSVPAQKGWQIETSIKIFKAVEEQKGFSLGPVRAPRHLFLYKMSFFRHYVFSNFLRMDRLYDIVKFVKFDSGAKLSVVPNCPWCQIVRGAKLSVHTLGAKLSAVLNCPFSTFGAKLSA